jgi:hypothetical protein
VQVILQTDVPPSQDESQVGHIPGKCVARLLHVAIPFTQVTPHMAVGGL